MPAGMKRRRVRGANARRGGTEVPRVRPSRVFDSVRAPGRARAGRDARLTLCRVGPPASAKTGLHDHLANGADSDDAPRQISSALRHGHRGEESKMKSAGFQICTERASDGGPVCDVAGARALSRARPPPFFSRDSIRDRADAAP